MEQLLKCKADSAVTVSLCVRSAPSSAGKLTRTSAEAADRPAGKNFRKLLYVLLRVPARDAKRVQLQQLARVVFVQPSPRLLAAPAPRKYRAPRARPDRLKVIEVHEHRRMLRRR